MAARTISLAKGKYHTEHGLRKGGLAISGSMLRLAKPPAHPNVEPLEKVRPTAAYMLSIDDIKEFPKYEKLWKEIFQIR